MKGVQLDCKLPDAREKGWMMSSQILEDAPFASLWTVDRTDDSMMSNEQSGADMSNEQSRAGCTPRFDPHSAFRTSQSSLTMSMRPPSANAPMASGRLTKAAGGSFSLAAAFALGIVVARFHQPGVEAPAVRPTG